jgi:hypothetical protein
MSDCKLEDEGDASVDIIDCVPCDALKEVVSSAAVPYFQWTDRG